MTPALRALFKAPGFTAVAVLTLAVGLGANTAIFSAVYAILLKPLPFPESERLVSVRAMVKRDTWERRSASLADFRDYRAQATRSFASFSLYDDGNYNLTGDGEAMRIRGEMVSHDYFATLGVEPALGRTFTAAEDAAAGQRPLIVLSDELWRGRYGASPDILGRTLKLSEIDCTVIGVMRPGFRGLNDVQFWFPTSILPPAAFNSRGDRYAEIVARLRSGVTLDQARAELAAIGLQLATAHPATNANYGADLAPLRDEFFGSLRGPLLVLLGAVGLVLLIMCANVANLMLVRLAARRREIAIRVSLGATRGALARLFVGEAFALCFAGGALGLLVALWLIAALRALAPLNLPSFVALELNAPVFAFGLILGTLCALVIGSLPALLAARTDLNAALNDAGRTGHSGAAGRRLRSGLVVAELAVALALLVASTLFVRSFVKLVSQSPGYRTEKLLSQRMLLPPQRYNDEALRQFMRTLLARATALPGVSSAAIANNTPLDGISSAHHVAVEGSALTSADNQTRVYSHIVSADFFRAAGIALLEGEPFAETYSAGSDMVAIVSENFARRFWPKGGALGQRFKIGRVESKAPWFRIVGVCAETKYRGLVANPTRDPDIYTSIAQRPTGNFSLLVQTAGESGALGHGLRQLVAALDPNIPVFALATIEERIAAASASQRFSAQLMGAFALVALLLAALGLYGVVSFSVGQRTPEIGVRMALGARPADILRMILGGTSRLVALGLAAGAALALGLTRFIEALLYDVNARDPLTYAVVAIVLALVALCAAWLPARRAARVDPITALRAE